MPTRNYNSSWWLRSPTNGSLWTTSGMVRFHYCDEFNDEPDYNTDSDVDFECSESEALDLFFEELEVVR